ncbi:hypothetical protein AXG93_3241s1100 [Marchantia polymorpha subsp. ruderalis]|uniref:Uncharacterized protein n=1 Tax=Marchantia polymorpha subsp. ruderalis TaxID=1480154 RepID=A0A176W8Y0_MARPO|nr:hypothetical protein AXG93_3241s1100 [Marchantia polymorpha subsp. ruderalis]
MVREWLCEKDQNLRMYRPHPERWHVIDWEQVLGRCAGSEGDLLFDSESVQLSKEEELTFDGLFKNRRSRKNVYKTRDYGMQSSRFCSHKICNPPDFAAAQYFLHVILASGICGAGVGGSTEIEEEHRGAQTPKKQKLDEEEEERRRESITVPSRRRATNEQARPEQSARKLILTAGSSADTGRTAISKGSPSLEE